MSTLRSAVEELLAIEVGVLSDAELESELAELEHASRAIEAARAARVAEADRRGTYVSDGFPSTAAWLRHRFGVAASTAAEQVRIARALERMPAARRALADGRIGQPAVALLASARDADPERFTPSKEFLVELGCSLSHRDLRSAVERWRQLGDLSRAEAAAESRFAPRGLFVSSTLDGMSASTETSIRRRVRP
jgi:hypothetical protein